MSLLLSRAPSFSAALPHALAAWRQRGGLLVLPRREAATSALLAEAERRGRGDGARGGDAGGAARPRHGRGRPARARRPVADRRPPGLREVLDRGRPDAVWAPRRQRRASSRASSARSASCAAPGHRRGAPLAGRVAHARCPRGDPRRRRGACRIRATRAGGPPTPPRRSRRFPPVTVAGFDDLDPAAWALLRALGAVDRGRGRDAVRPGPAAFEARRGRQARWAAEAGSATAGGAADGAGRASRAACSRTARRWPSRLDLRAWWAPPARAGCCARRSRRCSPRAAAGRRWRDRPGGAAARGAPRRPRAPARRLGHPGRAVHARARAGGAAAARAHPSAAARPSSTPDAPGALEHLLGWLRTPYSGADPAEVDRFEAHARRGGWPAGAAHGPLGRGGVARPATWSPRPARTPGPAGRAAAARRGGPAARRSAHALPSRADLRDRAALATLGG